MEVAVRPAAAQDLPVLEELSVQAYSATASIERGGVMWAEVDARRGRPANLTDAIDHEEYLLVVGTIDDVVVGYALARSDVRADGQRVSAVSDLWVEEAARGVGVGAALIAAIMEWATSKGCVALDAWALPGERLTKNFFEAAGLTARLLIVSRDLR
jgi:GNAT superfamily N-acetyltransferase